MTTPAPPAAADLAEPRWGLGDAAAGWLLAETMAVFASALVLGATGHLDRMGQAAVDLTSKALGVEPETVAIPLTIVAVLQAFLWVGLLGAPLLAARRKGNGVVRDFGLSFRWIDVPVGVAVGVACQVLLVPLLSWPWVLLLGKDLHDLDEPAQQLAAGANDPFGKVLLVLIVVVGAPLVEELFFRGLLQRSAERRWGPRIAVAVSAAVFGLTHFEVLQLPALVGFGAVLAVMAWRSGRLGPGIFAHLSFNAVTVIALLAKA